MRGALEPPAGVGPIYFRGGISFPDATATLPGDFTTVANYSGAAFTHLPRGEYTLRVADNVPSVTFVAGAQALTGYLDGRHGVIRTPVFDGQLTVVLSVGACRAYGDGSTCAAGSADATL